MKVAIVLLPALATAALLPREAKSTGIESYRARPACSPAKQRVRREWGDFSHDERLEYVKAVQCMIDKPSQLPKGAAPAAINRLDDFTATHVNLTLRIHSNGVFLAWHRQFTWIWEQALKKECGYKGTQPYWNWPLWADDLKASPLFDGSPTSIGGDGVYNATGEHPVSANGTVFPKGTGGGCVVAGPFSNRTLTFRNFAQNSAFSMNGVLPADALDYAPHCWRRDLNSYMATHFTNQAAVDYMIYQSPNISDLQRGFDFGQNDSLGVHPGGHQTVGPEMYDFFTSPNDPAFFLHHGMVDLVWTEWQARDPRKRQYALSGGSTLANMPPSPDVTLDYEMDFGYLGPKLKIGDAMDVTKGSYCYRYDYKGKAAGYGSM